jgi:predicted MPP superfamily phosphohydrolase
MSNRMNKFIIIFTVTILIIDLYTYKGMLKTFPGLFAGNWFYPFLHFGITLLMITSIWVITRFNFTERKPEIFPGFYLFAGIFMLIYLPKLVFLLFHLTEDIINILLKASVALVNIVGSDNIAVKRIHFLSLTGLILASVPFLAILYGITLGRFNYKIEKIKLEFPTLPGSFNGLKIIQISDLHLGSIYNKKEKIARAIGMINNEHPDLILFTGDMVNNFSEEALGWEDLFSQLKSTYGKYSVLGNHDYGDYWEWKNSTEKKANLALLQDIQKRMGFRLLLNESTYISSNGDSIALLGVENWGHPPFKQYGDLRKAQSALNGVPFSILLSHDPSHWDAEVTGKTDIRLTLSGHTHAMQVGIRCKGFQWSPVKYIYPQWNGLYKKGHQYLYVNRGLGFIGLPGRIGVPPEITVIELYRTVN